MSILIFLSSGIFLGWSLGANDAANVFGTAVGSRMIKFRTAALVCSFFIILGATISGAGAAHTLGSLGAINALPGAFTVALAAALATFWMTRLNLPVSTSQAIVGAILGWNFYSSAVTDTHSLMRIVVTWVACPILSGVMAVLLFQVVRKLIRVTKPHLLELDAWTRYGLLAVGAFGSYSLGANNIANVMGVFLPENPFHDIQVMGLTWSATQQLFLLGGLAISAGVLTYSQRVMGTVGGGIVKISPVAALVVVLAQSITLFLFASQRLEFLLASHHLPTFPLVPVSSSQAVIGAIVGLSLLQGGQGVRYRVLGEISLGWVATPVVAGLLSFVLLFFINNVFDQEVYREEHYRIDSIVVRELERRHLPTNGLDKLLDRELTNPVGLMKILQTENGYSPSQAKQVTQLAMVTQIKVSAELLAMSGDGQWLNPAQWEAIRALDGRMFARAWAFHVALGQESKDWSLRPATKLNQLWNKNLKRRLEYLDRVFQVSSQDDE